MQIIINIPDAIYKMSQLVDVKYEDTIQIPLEVIQHGKALPKKYGRLIDADSACEGNCAECPVNDICIVNKAPTVIEAYEGE